MSEAQQFSFHPDIQKLLDGNAKWQTWLKSQGSDFLESLGKVHAPKYLYIGCVDSRVPIEQFTNVKPGEILVHRNIANRTTFDTTTLSVMEFATQILRVSHVIFCGHSHCGGIATAISNPQLGKLTEWLHPVNQLYQIHKSYIDSLPQDRQVDAMSEINAVEQALNFAQNLGQVAWLQHSIQFTLHVWFYQVNTGAIKDLNVSASSLAEFKRKYEEFHQNLRRSHKE